MVLSLLFGGGGQIYLGQVSKGLLLIFGAIISQLSFVGIGFPILCVVDAYIMTKKLNNGNNIGEWEFGLNWRVFLIAVGTIIIFLFLGTINL
jgi:TM2 domain-containing membrane protein YozV